MLGFAPKAANPSSNSSREATQGSFLVPFRGLSWFLGRDFSVPPRQEVHRSIGVVGKGEGLRLSLAGIGMWEYCKA